MEEEEGAEEPGNDQPTLSIRNSQFMSVQQREISVTYPRPGLLRPRGLDEWGRRAHEGAHGELRVPRALVREALWAALVDVRQRGVCEVSREHEDLRW